MNSKLDILKMVESKEISLEKALELLETLEQTEKIEDELREDIIAEEDDESHVEAELVKSIDVALVASQINIERSNVTEVTVELFDSKTRELVEKPEWLQFYEEAHYFSIKETRTSNFSDVFDFFKGITINGDSGIFINVKLPKDFEIDKGKFSTVSGKISMIGVRGIDLEAKSVSGKIVATDIKAKVIQLKSTSGSIVCDNVSTPKAILSSTSGKIKASGTCAKLESKTVSGSIEISGDDNLKAITAGSVSGKIAVYLPEPEKYNLFFDSLSGTIDASGFAIVEKNVSGKKHISVDNRSQDRFIKASTVSGKIVLDRV